MTYSPTSVTVLITPVTVGSYTISLRSNGNSVNGFQGGGQGNANQAPPVNLAVVPPLTITSSKRLWYFGLDANGVPNVPPATFMQGDIKTTLTAVGGGAGSYTWVITQGTDKVSFASGAVLPLLATAVPNVTLYSLSGSTNVNDVTVTVTWTSGAGQPSGRMMLDVDSPGTLRLLNVPINQAVSDCTANHTPGPGGWWIQYQWRQISFFGAVIQGQSVNEAFSETVLYPAPAYPNGDNWGWRANGSAGVVGASVFVDNYCNTEQDFVPQPTNPQVPQLGNTLVDCAVQTYTIGSTAIGVGVPVQTQNFMRYIDHANVINITSPIVEGQNQQPVQQPCQPPN